MKFLFIVQHPGIFLRLADVARWLCKEGHEVVVHCRVYQKNRQKSWSVERLKELKQDIDGPFSYALATRANGWRYRLVAWKRRSVDYLAYLLGKDPISRSSFMVARAGKRVGVLLRFCASIPFVKTIIANRYFLKLSGVVEWLFGAHYDVRQTIAEIGPDLVVASPYIQFDSGDAEVEYIKAARSDGVPTAAIIASWDNLTSKGLIQIQPDYIYVWNQAQVRELAEIHDYPAEKAVVTGAPSLDKWFGRTRAEDRESFLSTLGVIADRRYITYLCSSANIAPDEPVFVREFVTKLQKEYGENCPLVIIRPHPLNIDLWDDFTMEGTLVFPRSHEEYVGERGMDYFSHTLNFSDCIVGLNTTAMIEAAIADKPIITIMSKRYQSMQEGAAHFHHLLDGAFMEVTQDNDEALRAIEAALSGADKKEERRRQFIQDFVRPCGIERPASVALAESLCAVASGDDPKPESE